MISCYLFSAWWFWVSSLPCACFQERCELTTLVTMVAITSWRSTPRIVLAETLFLLCASVSHVRSGRISQYIAIWESGDSPQALQWAGKKQSMKRQGWNSVQPDFIVSGPDHFTLVTIKHNKCLEKSTQITIKSAQVHNDFWHVYIDIPYKVHLASFTRMGITDSKTAPQLHFQGVWEANGTPEGFSIGLALR